MAALEMNDVYQAAMLANVLGRQGAFAQRNELGDERNRIAEERAQLAAKAEEDKARRAQIDQELKGAHEVMQNPYAPPEAIIQAMNKANDLGGITFRFTTDNYKASQDLVNSALDARFTFGPDSGEFKLAVRRAMESAPGLQQEILSRLDKQQHLSAQAGFETLASASGLAGTDPEAATVRNVGAALAGSKDLQQEVGKALVVPALDKAKISQLDQQIKESKAREAVLTEQQKSLLQLTRTNQLSADAKEAFAMKAPDRAAAAQALEPEIATLRQAQTTLAGQVKTAAYDPDISEATRLRMESDLADATLALTQRERQKYALEHPEDPDAFTAYQEADKAMLRRLSDRKAEIDSLRTGRNSLAQESLNLRKSESDFKMGQSKGMIAAGQEVADTLTKKAAKDLSLLDIAPIAKKHGVSPLALLEEVKKAAKDPNAPAVAITMKQEGEEAQTIGKGFGEQYLKIQESAASAGGRIAKLNRMESLLQGVETGKLTPAVTEIQALAESFGLPVSKDLPAKQALESLSNEMALELRNPSGGAGMPGALSDQDRAFLVSITPGLSKTPEGNRLIIETRRKLIERDQEVAQMARTYRKKHGSLDEGFYDELQTYSDKHPLFKGKTIPGSEATGKGGWSIKPLP